MTPRHAKRRTLATVLDEVAAAIAEVSARLDALPVPVEAVLDVEPYEESVAAVRERVERLEAVDVGRVRQQVVLGERVTAVEQRLGGAPFPHAPEYDAALPVPPAKWDRFGVRWSAFWRDGLLHWEAETQAGHLVLTHRDPHLTGRGPFTQASPLAEDAPSHRDVIVDKIAEAMSTVEHPQGASTMRIGRAYTDRMAQVAYDTMNADAEMEVKTDPADETSDEQAQTCGAWGGCDLPRGHNMGRVDIPENHRGARRRSDPENADAEVEVARDSAADDDDGEWINLHTFVAGAAPEKCEVCGGPADGILHEQPRGSGLWSQPWEPQVEPSDGYPLWTAVRQAVNDAAVNVRDTEKEQWLAAGLVRWIEHRYVLTDQPAYARRHSESDRAACMSCHVSAPICDRRRTDDSTACCGFCEVETFKVAHPVVSTTQRDPEDGMTDEEAGEALMDVLREARGDDVSGVRKRPRITVSGPGVERLREAVVRAQAEANLRVGDRGVAVRDSRMLGYVIDACDDVADGDQVLINRALKAEAEVGDLRRALGDLRTDFIRIQAIAGQHAAYEGNRVPREAAQ